MAPQTIFQVAADDVHAYVSTMKRADTPTIPAQTLERVCALVTAKANNGLYREMIEADIRSAVACVIEEGYKL